ncbi:MAG TPA: hypothetical protein VIN08_04455 [Ohtaekwangia sp.]|uniref:hypothetical protein n=1 Tax=Ohtaekwangia sp. TaxID=2066019 RepID=UPI002F9472A1
MQVRFLIPIFLVISLHTLYAQPYFREENWIDQLNLAGGLPEKLLSTRTAVFYDYTLTEKDLNTVQEYFQRSGIDAVAYHELDMLMSGKDITRAFSDFLEKREITNIVLIEKKENIYRIVITFFNGKDNIVDPKQNAWSASNAILTELLKNVYRTTSGQQKKLNLLINDVPETGLTINPILGKRNEFFAIDLKVDPLAVPKFGDEALDKRLEEIFKEHYPLKYKLTEPGLTEKELRKQGSLYVLCIVHTRGSALKELLGYPMTKSESALVSVTYPDTQQQLKNIPSNTPVYKVYFKHIDSGNVFLGTKWDSDVTWEQALINHIKGLKAELKLN